MTAQHWEAVVEGAARSGRIPDRGAWRIIRDVYVAPTDEEARDRALDGAMGWCWREFLLPIYLGLGLGPLLKHDPSLPDAAIDMEYVADHLWLTGSPATVTERVRDLQRTTGGFGYLIAVSYDASGERAAWERHLDLLIHEVLPACSAPPVTGARR